MTENIKKPSNVTVTKAKGRPMLTWVGKKPLARVRAYPAQAIERFDAMAGKPMPLQEADWSDWPKDMPKTGLLYHGDNKDVLAHLLANGFRGKVKLIYIDPPFDSGADYIRTVELRGSPTSVKVDGEEYSLGEQIQYSDIWANDNYLQFMYERLLMLRELLSDDGSLYLHCDWHKSHLLRIVLDEIFGQDNLQNEVIWQRTDPHNDAYSRYGWVHDTIYWYSKSKDQVKYYWEQVVTSLSPAALREYSLVRLSDGSTIPFEGQEIKSGRRFKLDDCTYKGDAKDGRFTWRGARPSNKRVWPYKTEKEMDEALERGEFYLRNPDKGAARCRVSFLDQNKGQVLQTIWNDCGRMKGGVDYPTQKPPALLERIIKSSTKSGDIVLDCFAGSGTTLEVAQNLGRRWIGCDINKGAIQTTAKRIQELMRTQLVEAGRPQQHKLIGTAEPSQKPSQLGFATYRVNDYDLHIQHNEAVELACEHLGITRTRTDSFFDGTQGGRLVKIVPFNHPLTPLDLEAVRNELKTRPTEERDVTVVCLGWQYDARAWVETYNRNRPVNKLHVVELRTDRKLGGIIKHEPLSAQVSIRRTGQGDDAQLIVEVQDVVSPTIIQRLNLDQGVFRAQITDWRAVVDCILIDTRYDGQVFNVALADVPESKQELVVGLYELPAPHGASSVAVKIVDMLGEETIVCLSI